MWRDFMNSQEAGDSAVIDELHQLMARLSLGSSLALAAVAEVAHEVAEQWLTGHRAVPAEVVVMLRGLAAIQVTQDPRRR